MRICNPDGAEAEACGNGTRCVARTAHGAARQPAGPGSRPAPTSLVVSAGVQGYTVDMGRPRFDWDEIPLAQPMDTLCARPGARPARASPWPSAWAIRMRCSSSTTPRRWRSSSSGPSWSTTRCFRSAPISTSPRCAIARTIRLRVWERGAGLTTRLRHRRLRRPGRRGAARPCRAQRRSAARWRPPADRLEQGRSGADDRPGEPQLQRPPAPRAAWSAGAHERARRDLRLPAQQLRDPR